MGKYVWTVKNRFGNKVVREVEANSTKNQNRRFKQKVSLKWNLSPNNARGGNSGDAPQG